MGEEWDVSGMVEGYSIDGPQAPSNAHSFFENLPMIDSQKRNEGGLGVAEESEMSGMVE